MENNQYFGRIRRMFGSFSFGYDTGVSLSGLSESSKIRKESISALDLKQGDLVFDICCGTGLNFKLLENVIGENGRIVGIDLTPQMIDIARVKSEAKGLTNICLVNSNVLSYKTDNIGDCAICTAGMGMIPEFSKAIDIVMEQIKIGGRFAIVDVKKSSNFPFRLFNFFFYLFSKSANFDIQKRDLIAYVKSKYKIVFYKEYFGGFCYVIVFKRNG
jgi:ubiquinone/menaquinone biosynthesis C-methylase UbiE